MTRWWTYAVLAIALIAGGVRAHASPHARARSELRESTHAAATAGRKRSGKAAQLAGRDASSDAHVIVPDLIELAARWRAWKLVPFVVCERQTCARAVIACSRAPPSE